MDTTGYNIPICSSNNIHNCSYYPPVSGYAYYDVNDDCVFDQNETGLSGRVIQLDDESYAITDSSGYYFSVVDTGEHTINQVHDNLLWDIVCPGIPYNVDFTAYSDSASNINFPNSALENCSWLWVDIASPFQRRCFQNTYRVDYCNRGTVAESNAFIEITFETEVIPLSSSLPWSSVSGNTYRFDIGYLDVEDCGWFTITDSISCDAFIGQTACATAIIYPVSPCLTGDNGWDNSSIQATGKCTGNSNIEFVLKNTGTGNMAGQSFYRIFEDNVLITANGAFQLSANDSIVIPISASGKTYRIEAEQRSGHPGNSLPRASVEYCGNPQFSQGQITAVAEDDADDYIETDCKVIIASYDPNDKTVIPSGIGTAHYIKPDDFLEYMIRFQNTGTDTAFTVEIVDTLANLVVDPLTFESGAASHPYSVSMRGNGIITWRFANILLPDSNVNEMASHGFIKYKIKQRSGNVNGTVVNNTAHIYFDYNAAIVTNTSSVTISDTLILPGMNEMNNQNDVTILVYPNPFSNETTLEIKTALIYKKGVVELRDGFGRLLNSYSISTGLSHVKVKRNNLSAGLYFYSVILDDRITSNGKLVIQN
ncbi:MAG: T9SS type A sorting domain-containing protein [Bacteroidia bacterium]